MPAAAQGRDLKSLSLGHRAIGLEGCAEFAAMARGRVEVWEQNFLSLDLPPNHFDGIFANAALFMLSRSYRVSCGSSMPP